MSAIATPPAPAGTVTPAGAGPKPWRWTRAQYFDLCERGFFEGRRVQLVLGEIVEMPGQNWPHVVGRRKTAERLRAVFAASGWVNEQSPFPFGDSAPEPDVWVVPGRFEDYSDHPTGALLIVEVADSTLSFDLTEKAELYATAGVADYWVLDVTGRELHVFRDPQPLPKGLGATAYRTHTTHGAADSVAPLAAPGTPIQVSELLP